MSVQVRRRRESAAFLATYVGAQGELLVDTTNNRVQVHDGATPGGWPAAKLSEVIVSTRTPVADASYTASLNDRTVAFTSLTAPRTVTLPAASTYQVGIQLLVVDESGACSFTTPITITRAGSDTINGATSAVINSAYGFLVLVSNGTNKWTIVDFTGATTAQLTNRSAAINGNFSVNQRGYASGTALAAGAYAHDRFKAGAGGCTYSFTQSVPDTTITITAGTLIHAVEAPNVTTSAWWLTWTGTATARVWQGSASGAYAAGLAMTIGGVAVNALLVTGLTAGAIANIEFSTGTLGLVQFEAALPNAGPTRFERRMLAQELLSCQRYFYQAVSAGDGRTLNFSNYAAAASGQVSFPYRWPVPMRATPTVTIIGAWTATNVSTWGVYAGGPNEGICFFQATAAGQCNVYPQGGAGASFSAEI